MNHLKLTPLCLLIFLFACKTSKTSTSTATVKLNLEFINDNPGKYIGKTVELEGTYLGWSGSGCNYISNYAHQITRSDWTFSDSDGSCIFVTGGKPDFLNPMENNDTGKKIKLKAQVKEDSEYKLYLEFISVTKI